MIKAETVTTGVKVFSVKSNASRAAKAYLAKNGENGLAYAVAAVVGGFEVQIQTRGGHRAADLQAAGFRVTPWNVASTDTLPARAAALAEEAASPAQAVSEEAVDAALDARFADKPAEDVVPRAAIDAGVDAANANVARKAAKRAGKAPTANSADAGVTETFEEALAAGAARYGYNGKSPNFIAERGKGGWVWGPLPARAPKADKPAAGVAKAAQGKRAEVIEAAMRGELPTPPDFSAALHERNRPKLAKLIEMAQAGDIDGLKAFPIKPNCTSPKAMDRYRNLAVMALEARAAQLQAA